MAAEEKIVLSHGSGGKKSSELFERLFLPHFDNPYLNEVHDGAIFNVGEQKLAFSTDSYVVKPQFFPGGNIGDLAVNGTVNDIAMCGASPRFVSTGFIIEEGFELAKLETIVKTMANAARKAGVMLVTGDTKVVEHGAADGVFINTSGVGPVGSGVHISPRNAGPGDVVIVNGFIGDHGIAVLSAREGFDFSTDIVSDSQPLNHLVAGILKNGEAIHVLRDPTRGGLAATLNEIAGQSDVGIELDETRVPIREQVRSLSEILGIDPFYIANEGKLITIVAERYAETVLEEMKRFPEGEDARIIGRVTADHPGQVISLTEIGTSRLLDMPVGEKLPRIC